MNLKHKETLGNIGYYFSISIIIASSFMLVLTIVYAELSVPQQAIQVPELEKSEMQTIYEDQEKKIMLPYDPERINHFLIVGMIMTFLGGMGGGYVLNDIIRSKNEKTKALS